MTDAAWHPLAGIRIIDLTTVVCGPTCTLRLAQYGAEIIKVEAPGGDLFRRVAGPSPSGQHGGGYLHLNREKRSLGLDLKQAPARAALLRLIARADVFVTNVRPDALARLGLDAATLCQAHPDLIHCSITGFGPGGPSRGKPAYDAVIQSLAGITALFQRRDGAPAFAPLLLADRIVGEITAGAIAAAVARRTGADGAPRGAAIEVPMHETMAAFVLQEHLGPASFDPPLGPVGDSRTLDPGQRPCRTQDGWISVSATNDAQAAAFLRAAGLPPDPRFTTAAGRFEHVSAWTALRAEILATRTSAAWIEAFEAADVPASACHSLETLLDDPHLAAVGLIGAEDHPTEGRVRSIRSSILFDGAPAPSGPPAAPLGADTRTVLAEAGLSQAEIEHLLETGAAIG